MWNYNFCNVDGIENTFWTVTVKGGWALQDMNNVPIKCSTPVQTYTYPDSNVPITIIKCVKKDIMTQYCKSESSIAIGGLGGRGGRQAHVQV